MGLCKFTLEANDWTNNNAQHNIAADGFKVKSWRHTTWLWTVPWHCDRGVARGALAMSVYAKHNMKFLTCASQTPRVRVPCISYPKPLQGGVLIQVNRNPIQEIGPKAGGGCSSRDYSSWLVIVLKFIHVRKDTMLSPPSQNALWSRNAWEQSYSVSLCASFQSQLGFYYFQTWHSKIGC